MAEIVKKITDIKDGYLYIVLYILVVIPLVNPIGIGIGVGTLERLAYNTIEETPDGSTVMFMNSFDTWTIDTEGPTLVLIEHMFRKDFKVILIPHSPPSIANMLQILEDVPSAIDKVYGEDYIMLQILVDDEVNMARFAADIQGTSPVDGVLGEPIGSFPIMENVHTVDDIALGIAKQAEGQHYIRQIAGAYGVPTIMVHGSDYISKHASMVQADIIQGAVDGITSYAGYEVLIGLPGKASSQMDSLSIAIVFALVLLIIGNVNMFLQKGERQTDGMM
jgi:hypothetical protein